MAAGASAAPAGDGGREAACACTRAAGCARVATLRAGRVGEIPPTFAGVDRPQRSAGADVAGAFGSPKAESVDITLLMGLAISLGSLGLTVIMDGGELFGFVGISAALLVFGSTFGVVVISHPLAQVRKIPKLLSIAMKKPADDPNALVTRLVELAERARREGLLLPG